MGDESLSEDERLDFLGAFNISAEDIFVLNGSLNDSKGSEENMCDLSTMSVSPSNYFN